MSHCLEANKGRKKKSSKNTWFWFSNRTSPHFLINFSFQDLLHCPLFLSLHWTTPTLRCREIRMRRDVRRIVWGKERKERKPNSSRVPWRKMKVWRKSSKRRKKRELLSFQVWDWNLMRKMLPIPCLGFSGFRPPPLLGSQANWCRHSWLSKWWRGFWKPRKMKGPSKRWKNTPI